MKAATSVLALAVVVSVTSIGSIGAAGAFSAVSLLGARGTQQAQAPPPRPAPSPTGAAGAPAPARDARVSDVAPSGSASLAGVVVDHERQPVRRALVAIGGSGQGGRSVVTDDAGRFTMAGLPAGRYTITASKPGYPQMSYGARQAFKTGSGVVLADGQHLSGLALTLARGAVLEGTAFDEQGRPMPGVPVMPWEVRTSLVGDRTLTMPRTGGEATTTDDRGMFRLYGLPPGEYTVGTAWFFNSTEARVPGDDEIRAAFAATSGRGAGAAGAVAGQPSSAPPPAPSFAYSPVFHPDTIDAMSARTYVLAAAEERTGVDVRMQLRPMSRIEATVVDADGTPATAEVSLLWRTRVEALGRTTVSFISNGQYRTSSLPQGDYALVVVAPPSGDKPARSVTMPISITSPEPVVLALSLQPTPPLQGRVVFAGETLTPPDPTTARVNLFSAPGSFGNFNSVRSSVDAMGAITIVGVTPGRYRVVASVANQPTTGPAWTLRSVVVDGRDVTDLPIEVPAGAPPSLTVTFTDQISELSGRLVQPSGQPGRDYFVIVLAADRRYWLPQARRITSTRPDITGRYQFRGLPAGEYRVAVTTELDPQDLTDATILERLLEVSTPVTIGVGEKRTLDVRVN